MDEKENTAPLQLGLPAQRFGFSPVKKDAHKSRSKSIGSGGLDTTTELQRALTDRTQSDLNTTVRSILPDKTDVQRKEARRKSMANRRVSFAPEATLHMWDVVEYMKDHTTSTENSDGTRHGALSGSASAKSNQGSPSSQLTSDDDVSMSGMSDDSAESLSEGEGDDEDEDEDDEDATGTAMSLVTDGDTTQGSAISESSSTSSSLDRNLRMAAQLAGTRGIEYDEYGEMSMEMVGQEITNAFQPWIEHADDERRRSAAYDQENMNPFTESGLAGKQELEFRQVEQDDLSMDVTRAVGGILSANLQSSPFAEIPMDFTQALGGIRGSQHQSPVRSGQKRKHATMSEEAIAANSPNIRVQQEQSPERIPGVAIGSRYESRSGDQTGARDETMDFTRAVGGIRTAPRVSEASFDGNEDFSMELTTVIGGISDQHAELSSRHAVTVTSSPFHVDVEPTVTRATDEQQALAAEAGGQSPTPRPRIASSGRKSSARSRRTSALITQNATESSPVQRRVSRRLSARSSAEQSPAAREHEVQALPTTPSTVTRLQNKDHTPQQRPKTGSVSRSPRRTTEPPMAAVKAAQETPPAQRIQTPVARTTPIGNNIEQRSISDAIKLMTTPRKETLKSITPKKATPSSTRKSRSALKSPDSRQPVSEAKAVKHTMNDDLVQIATQDEAKSHIHLQEFLDEAGIRFMDLTTSKRRLTTATTPSRLRKINETNDESEEMISTITLDDAVVAAACAEPELELFKHACYELKRYIDEGRSDIKVLEAQTLEETPVLIKAYMAADKDQRSIIDAHLRNIKTNSRLRSKEMWYGWRSNLVDDLMRALQTIAEDLLADDEILQQKEELLRDMLPPMLERRTQMQARAEKLLATADRTKPEEKEGLLAARKQLLIVDNALEERTRLLNELTDQLNAQNSRHEELDNVRKEYLETIQSVEDAKASGASVSVDQFAKLSGAVTQLENDYEWAIQSANLDPPMIAMTYKSQLELFFHPLAFQNSHIQHLTSGAPIGLRYIPKEAPCTTRRFFLQLLRAYLHSMVPASMLISDMLTLVASMWDSALQLVETERLLAIEGPVQTWIHNDECLVIDSLLLLPAVRTKLCASFKISVTTNGSQHEVSHEPAVKIIYGEAYNEKGMSDFMRNHTESGFESWASVVQALRKKLVQQGPKSTSA